MLLRAARRHKYIYYRISLGEHGSKSIALHGKATSCAYIDLCGQLAPNFFVTLARNMTASKESVSRLVRDFCARMNRKLLGHTWTMTAASERSVFFIEHVTSNIHAHGPIRIPSCDGVDVGALSEGIWPKLCPGGSVVVMPINDVTGCASYCTKEMRDFRFGDDQIVLMREFIARAA